MRIAISGSSGLIGSSLRFALEGRGHQVTRIVRPQSRGVRGQVVVWDPPRGMLEAAGLEGHDVVIHLAGENIAGLWTRRKKAALRESRIVGTRLLSETLARLRRPPRALLSASAAGYYGNRPAGVVVDEDSPPGTGFLAELAVEWERATEAAASAGIRVVCMRFGLVLSRKGGVLAPMLPLFRLGLGARLGTGEQAWSWIALAEIAPAVWHVLEHATLTGPINFVAPRAVTQAEFVRTLAHVLRRPAFVSLPEWLLRPVLGEMADELFLNGVRVAPRRLAESGYRFRYPDLEPALRALLGASS